MQGNPNVAEVHYTQTVSFDASTASSATQDDTTAVSLYATSDCWINRSASSSATVTPGADNVFIPASVLMTLPIIGGFIVAAIKDSSAGTLHIYEHNNIYP